MPRPLSLPRPLHQEVGDITVSPARNCLSSSNSKPVSRTTCSFSHVASSMGKSFHLIRYSLMLLFQSLFSRTYSISFGIRTSCPSSSKGGNTSRGVMCCSMALFDRTHGRHYVSCCPMEVPTHKLRPLPSY
jgi:hypothetical protein